MTVEELLTAYANGERNFKEVDLRGAYLQEAYLQEADLQGANLQGANLQEADLQGANLRRAKGYFSFFAYGTSGRIVHCVRHESGWMVQAGCFWGTLDQLYTQVMDTHGLEKGKVYLAMIELLKAL